MIAKVRNKLQLHFTIVASKIKSNQQFNIRIQLLFNDFVKCRHGAYLSTLKLSNMQHHKHTRCVRKWLRFFLLLFLPLFSVRCRQQWSKIPLPSIYTLYIILIRFNQDKRFEYYKRISNMRMWLNKTSTYPLTHSQILLSMVTVPESFQYLQNKLIVNLSVSISLIQLFCFCRKHFWLKKKKKNENDVNADLMTFYMLNKSE